MKIVKHQTLACAAALALLFASAAGAAEITGPVTSQEQITPENDTEYNITSTTNGIYAESTGIIIGGDDTQNITVNAETNGIYVNVEANATTEFFETIDDDMYIGTIEDSDSTNSASNAAVVLTAAQDNIVTGGEAGIYASGVSNGEASQNNIVTSNASSDLDTVTFQATAIAVTNPSVVLIAGEDNIVSGGTYGIRADGTAFASTTAVSNVESDSLQEANSKAIAIAASSPTVTLQAGQDNYIYGDTYGISSSVWGNLSAAAGAIANNERSYAYAESDLSVSSTVTLTAGQDNYVYGGNSGIYSDVFVAATAISNADTSGSTVSSTAEAETDFAIDVSSTVTMAADRDNIVTGDVNGIYSNVSISIEGDQGISSGTGYDDFDDDDDDIAPVIRSEVTLAAGRDNIVNGGETGVISQSESSVSKVTLTAERDNIVTGDYGVASWGEAVYSNGEIGSSEITLSSGRNNNVVSASVGVASWSDNHGVSVVTLTAGEDNTIVGINDYGVAARSYNGGRSEIALTAEQNNTVTGGTYGVAARATEGGSAAVTLKAGVTNTITATDAGGTAVYADNGTIDITGATVLYGDNGAYAENGGKIIFNDGLVTTTASTLTATKGGVIEVNDKGGSVSYIGTTSFGDNDIDEDNAPEINMQLLSGSAWYLTGDSAATTLENSGGLLDMTADGGAFSKLFFAESFAGDGGTILMDIGENGADRYNNSDIIGADGSFTGQQYVTLAPTNGTNVSQNAVGTTLLIASDLDGTLTVNDNEGTLFWQKFEVDSRDVSDDEEVWGGDEGTELYLSSISNVDPNEKETTTVSSVMSAASLNYHTWMMQNTKMLERLGDLRQGANNGDNGAWFRISGSKLDLGGQHGFENKYIQYEVGYDKIIAETSQYTMYGGLAITYADGDSDYNRGSGDNESKAVSLYFTQINKGGSYLDLVFKLGRWENDFKVYDTVGRRIEGETESTGMSLSAEYGKKIAMGNKGLYIEPQAQLTYGHFDGDSYTLSNGVNVHSEGIESLVGRAGFNLGWDINPRANVYLKANVLYEFLGDYGITMSDDSGRLYKSGDYSDTWFLYGLGGAFKLGRENSGSFLHFDIERSTGGDLDQEWFYNVGFRFVM